MKKRKKKSIIEKTLFDPLHWIGWVITAFSIMITFHLLGVRGLLTPYYNALIVLAVVAIVDVFKHAVELQ